MAAHGAGASGGRDARTLPQSQDSRCEQTIVAAAVKLRGELFGQTVPRGLR